MKDFEYLESLPFTAAQRKALIDQGLHRTAKDLLRAIHVNPKFKSFLFPLDVQAVRTLLWRLMTPEEQDSWSKQTTLQKDDEDSFEKAIGGMVMLLLFALLIAYLLTRSCVVP